jgi:hypothetical protein
MVYHDASGTGLLGEVQRFWLSSRFVLHADICQLAEVAGLLARTVCNVASQHAETGLEGCYLGGLRGAEESVRHVVYDLDGCQALAGKGSRKDTYHAAIGTFHALLCSLWNALECAVFGFEVYYRRPVVAYKSFISTSGSFLAEL